MSCYFFPLHLEQPTHRDNGRKGTVISIKIVTTEKRYYVQEYLLTYDSLYFSAVFELSFREAGGIRIDLTDVEPDTFKRFIDSLYTEELTVPKEDQEEMKTNSSLKSTFSW
ncbi:hypothetical protein GQ43DRAFT_470493 [Delitschia confertaspora ATCC 74209]|uniref:BTB domain-containing protein n=1 Tax=Delitschia confertaspora ATCC 74209 TaxID=1513339 RepID=A0A9P4MUA4_9PLEO|nr:hypothetical protein GQ43DRAFT_470493 [Delitschia confertaspora ATCC 74209]